MFFYIQNFLFNDNNKYCINHNLYMLNENAKIKINAYIFFGLFLLTKVYFNSYEDMRESVLTGALILGLVQ
jgi:hypothetical protein